MTDESQSMMEGREIGAYRIISLLGKGGMGEVYRAHDTKLHRDVAIKVLPASVARDPERASRFAREARLLASLSHPNIAAIHGVEEWEGTSVLILELIEGETLAERIAGGLEVGPALELARQIAEGLEAAHEKGVIHRDLKPGNVKVTPGGRVKVLDFGLAKALGADGASLDPQVSRTQSLAATELGALMGTAGYMAPEQARGEPADRRADIWAFGCVLFEMLSGRQAFAGATLSDILVATLQSEPDWTRLPAATPHGIRRLVRRCLEKDPGRRLRDVGDARLEIEDAMGRAPEAEPAPVAARWLPLAWALGGAMAGALLVTAAWWQGGRSDTVPQNPLAGATFQRLTSSEASELDAAISPDGRFVVFVSNRDGPYDAWVTQVGTGALTNVTKGTIPYILNDEIRNVGFTADNQVALTVESRDANGKGILNETHVLPLTGGPMRRLLDRGVEAVWSADGSRVAYHESGPGDPIIVADRNGRDGQQIHKSSPGIHSHYLTWSPDGRFIYFVHGVPPDEMDLWRIPSGGGTAEQLTFHNADVAYPAFIDSRTLLYRATGADGLESWLYAIDVERPAPYRVTVGVEQYLSVAATTSGRRLVATVANPTSGLWMVPITDSVAEESSATAMALSNVRALSPRFGADCIWYLSSDGGVNGLWRFSNGTAQEIWKPGDRGLAAPPALSSDGQLIAFLARRQQRRQLYVMSSDGTNVRTLAESLEARDAPTWSSDGQ
jgi:Tol biopolymer transport system component